MPRPTPPDGYELDPVFVNARREAIIIFLAWVAGLAWCVPFCYLTGYLAVGEDASQLPLVLGVPRWVFFGILVPWLVADLFTTWFCFRYMKDDDLEPAGGSDEGGEAAE